MDLEDSREFAFCQYCGTKVMIQEEIVKQKVTIDHSEDLKNVLKLAIIAFTEQNLDKVKELADKALEMDVNCLDAMNMKIAVAKANGGDYQALMELSKQCTKDLGLFSQDDISKYIGSRVSLAMTAVKLPFGQSYTSFNFVIDNKRKFALRVGSPIELYLPNGKHTLAIDEVGHLISKEFTVTGDCGFVVTLDKYAKLSIKSCLLQSSEINAESEADRPSPIKIRMPKEYIHKEGKFDHFELRSRAVKLGAIETMILSPGPQTMTFVEVTKKGLIGTNKHEYKLQFDVEKDASYTINIEDSNYVIKKD